MKSKIIPNLDERPNHLILEKQMKANAADLYKAWTEDFDLWFAQPGELIMVPEIDKPFFFYNRHDWGRHAHYGRFIKLEKNRHIEMTWLTGDGGTFGAETVITIELIPQDQDTIMYMTHSGFNDEKAAKAHKENWPIALDELDQKLTN